jgi:hypothetical protein
LDVIFKDVSVLGDVLNLCNKNEKTRERARLINLRIFCLEEIRNSAYPHFSYTRGRVKHNFKKAFTHISAVIPVLSCTDCKTVQQQNKTRVACCRQTSLFWILPDP